MLRDRACLLLLLAVTACSTVQRPASVAPQPCAQLGLASWYRPALRRSADGHRDAATSLVAAHRTLPFGTRVRVIDLDSGRSVVVRIDDRGPFVRGRIIDLSPEAARRIGMRHDGVASVRLEPADPPQQAGACLFGVPGST